MGCLSACRWFQTLHALLSLWLGVVGLEFAYVVVFDLVSLVLDFAYVVVFDPMPFVSRLCVYCCVLA